MKSINELEKVILDQIEKLNDDSLFSDAKKAKILIEKSKAITELSTNFCELNQLKLKVIHAAIAANGKYKTYLGIEDDTLSENLE